MKRYIRLYAGLIAVFMFIFNVSASAATFSDVTAETQYREAINTLTTIGLIKGYEDGSFRPENNITRAEFTTIAVRAVGMEDQQSSEEAIPFSDLSSHYSRFNVKTAYDMGIINGFGDGTFHPDDNVTYEQAVKMVVCMLGYGNSAMKAGGYPTGYISIAMQLGLTDGITAPYTQPASRGVIAKLVNNSLNARMQKSSVSADGTYRYTVTDDTLLKTKLKIERLKVLVTGVGSSVIAGSDSDLKSYEMRAKKIKDNDNIVLDFSALFKDYDEPKKYLGHTIYVFYRDIDDDETTTDELIAIDDNTETAKEFTLLSKDIDSFNQNTGMLKYKTEDASSKLQSVKIKPENMTVVYNTKVTGLNETVELADGSMTMREALPMMLDPESENFFNGEIKLLDSESDGEIDVIFIMNYRVMVANSAPTSTDYRLSNKYVTGDYMILDPDDDKYKVTITRNGTKVSNVAAIRANDIVLYAVSTDGEYITLNVNAAPVSGAITGIDNDEDKITVGGKEYSISPVCRKYVEDCEKLKVGADGTFHIDSYGNIVYLTVSATSVSVTYGAVINAATNEDIDRDYATIYSAGSSGDIKRYNFADKVSVNGSNVSSGDVISKLRKTSEYSREDIENKDKVYANSNTEPYANEVAQIVKYSLKKDELSSIITLKDEGGESKTNTESELLVKYKPLAKYTYSASNNFSNEFYINSSTVILYIPGDRSARSDYQKFTASNLFKTNQSYWAEPYDVNESKVASLVVVYGNSSLADITKDTVMSVVAKTPTLVDVSDDSVNKLSFYNSSTAVTTKNADNDTEFADVKPGDVIQYGQSNSGRIINRRNVILAADVAQVIENDKTYDWTDDKFDVRFVNDEGNVEWDFESGSPYSRAFVANVVEAKNSDGETFIRVTKDGFDADGTISSENEERYELTSSTPIIRLNLSKETLSTYVEGTTTKLSVDDLSGAKTSGTECSKVFLYTIKGKVKFMMIYE